MGDVFPILGFCRAVSETGHSVAVMTSGNFRTDVTAAGLEYLELCDADSSDACRRFFNRSFEHRRPRGEDREEAIVRSLTRALPERIYALSEQNYEPGETVLAGVPWFTFGAFQIVQTRLQIPTANIWVNVRDFCYVQPLLPSFFQRAEDGLKNMFLKLYLPDVVASVGALRKRLGLLPDSNFIRTWFYSADLNIALFPEWFVSWFKGGLNNTVVTQFPLYQRDQNEGLPEQLQHFLSAGDAPVLITNASWRLRQSEFLEASMDACNSLGLRAIFLTDAAHDSICQNRTAITAPYAALNPLLPQVSAVVHHGGLGTIAAVMAAGKPQVAVPWVNDNAHNAAYVRRFGVGLSLRPKRYIHHAPAALRKVLNDDDIRRNCLEVANRFSAVPDFSPAIQQMEALLQTPLMRHA
jgi:UDP:flavonoid glycosyltransferase YjiC (YdhE family)